MSPESPPTPPTPRYAVTVLGHDRPGIIAEATGALAHLGLNLEDSTMTLLRGHFAMVLVCAGDVAAEAVATALAPLGADAALTVSVREVPQESRGVAPGTPWVLTVHGGDRPGIVSSVLAALARAGGNVTDLSTRLAGELYLLVAEFELPPGADTETLAAALDAAAAAVGVRATLRAVDADQL